MDFKAARRTMIDTQLRPNDVTDHAVVDAFMSVPREVFIPKSKQHLAYSEYEIETSDGRWLWTPRDFGKLVAAAKPEKTDTVLVIGAGSGYEAVVLSRLTAAVIALDSEDTAEAASSRFADANADNAVAVGGELKAGLASEGPFDLIFVCGMVQTIPDAWKDQLKDGGRMAVVVETQRGMGRGRIYKRSGEAYSHSDYFDATPPKWPEFDREKAFSL